MNDSTPNFFNSILSFGEGLLETAQPFIDKVISGLSDDDDGKASSTATAVLSSGSGEIGNAAVASQSAGLVGFVESNPALVLGGAALALVAVALIVKG